LSCSEQELLGSGFKELLDFKELGIDLQMSGKISLIPVLLKEEGHCFKKDGNEIWVSITPYFLIDSENKPSFIVLQIEDITGQKKADISFQAPERNFDFLYENISEGVIINEQVGKFLEANPAICKKVGYSKEELLHKTTAEFIARESSKIFAEKVRELYRNGKAKAQIRIIRKGGELLPVEVSMWLVEYQEKPAVFSIISDVKE
jgi:PAS domain S-box-containing protein